MQAEEFVIGRDVDGEALVVRLAPDPLLAALRGLLRDQVLGQRQRMYSCWDMGQMYSTTCHIANHKRRSMPALVSSCLLSGCIASY
jgi:hypothetical protein